MSITILQPIEKRPTKYRESAYTAIKEAILAGQLPPDRPLVEEHLASLLHISRTPVREALAILEHEGLIGPRGGRGLYVRPLTREEFVEMFVANEAVEPYLVRRVAHLATEDQLQVLGETVSRGKYYAAEGDLPRFLKAGREFHRLVGVAAENAPLTEFVVRNEEHTGLYLLSHGKAMTVESMQVSNREHEAILNAIVRRDPDEAARLAVYHAQSLRERLADLFSSPEEEWADDWQIEQREFGQ